MNLAGDDERWWIGTDIVMDVARTNLGTFIRLLQQRLGAQWQVTGPMSEPAIGPVKARVIAKLANGRYLEIPLLSHELATSDDHDGMAKLAAIWAITARCWLEGRDDS